MTYALNGKENCRKRGLLPCRNGLCLLLTILNKIKPYLDVCENISHLMSPAKEVLEEEALLVPASPGATVPASLSGEGGRRPGRSRSSRKQSAGTPAPPCSESPGGNTQYDGFCNSPPLLYYLSWRTFQTRRVQQKALSIVTTGDLALDLFTSSVGRQDPAGGGSSSCSTIAYQLWPLWLLLISEIWTDNCNLHCLG